MAEINSKREGLTAKAGDKISKKARKVLAKFAYGMRGAIVDLEMLENIPSVVEPKTEGNEGQWFCIDCGALPQHNLGAWSHSEQKPKHRFAWRNFATGLGASEFWEKHAVGENFEQPEPFWLALEKKFVEILPDHPDIEITHKQCPACLGAGTVLK